MSELKIRDICGDYALDIPFADGSVNTIYFNSKRNAETVKHIIEVDGSKPNEATVCDMQEIKYGKWEYDSGDVGYTNYLCSECKNFSLFTRALICIHIALTAVQKWIRSVKNNGIPRKAKSVKT